MEVNVKNSNNIISKVYKDSIAEEIGIEVGDLLIAVNDEKIHDIIEYKFLISDEYIELEIQKKDGEVYIYEIEKDFDEELGIEFVNPIIDKAKSCRNKCIFCFIDQLPKGMRDTLYFKDDDSRLSFLQGNFITLTNMSEEDIENIIKYRISPINISVHTTNPELRRKMINNKHAGKLLETMKRLADAQIEMNCQIVLCPGYNDKEELDRTLKDLSSLHPYVNSVAIVPVGITKYREKLAKLEIFDYEKANETIDQVHALQKNYLKELNTRFAFLSDEFYIIAKRPLLNYDEYEGFLQFEDGVGMIVKQRQEIIDCLDNLNVDESIQKKVSIATGSSAYEFISEMADKIMEKFRNIEINVYKIQNDYFGHTITVSGLITATDIIGQLKDKDLGIALYITRSMLKNDDEDVFLDDITLEELCQKLNVQVIPCENEGREFVEKIIN